MEYLIQHGEETIFAAVADPERPKKRREAWLWEFLSAGDEIRKNRAEND